MANVKLDKSEPGGSYREYYDAGKIELLANFGLPRGDEALMALPEAGKLLKAYDHVKSLNDLRISEDEIGHIRDGRLSQVVHYYYSVGGGGRLWADCDRVSLQRMSKRLRPLICGGIYTEADLENCHPVVLLGVIDALNAAGKGVHAPRMREYVARREEIL